MDTVRNVHSLSVMENDNIITIRITGNGFLYNMVRIIAGTLIKVGKGSIEPETVASIILSKDRNNAGPTAPARGLSLMEIRFLEK